MMKMGKMLGVSQTYISQVLSGINKPGPKVLEFLGLKAEKTVTVTYFEAAAGNGKRNK